MNQVHTIITQIKKNYKVFILVNFIFITILILFYNFSQNKNTNKYNYKITIEYNEKSSYLYRFDITSFADKALYKNFKKNKIYLEKQIFLPQIDTYYFFILDDDLINANDIFEERVQHFLKQFIKTREIIIKNLELENNDLLKFIKKNKSLECPSLIEIEKITCKNIKDYEIKILENLELIDKIKKESFDYNFLNIIKNIEYSSLDKEYKLYLIIFIGLILNFLIIFNQKNKFL